MKRHGRRGILGRALIGIVLNGLLIIAVLFGIRSNLQGPSQTKMAPLSPQIEAEEKGRATLLDPSGLKSNCRAWPSIGRAMMR